MLRQIIINSLFANPRETPNEMTKLVRIPFSFNYLLLFHDQEIQNRTDSLSINE